MIKIEPFSPEHVLEIELQPNQQAISPWLKPENYRMLRGFTARINGKIIFIGGLAKIFDHRYFAWSLISWDAGKYLLAIIRRISRYFKMYYNGCRIECTCHYHFAAAHRLARLLGFKCEAQRMEMYEINKDSSSLYAQIIRR